MHYSKFNSECCCLIIIIIIAFAFMIFFIYAIDTVVTIYLRVIIICFLRFWHFVSTKFCDLYAIMVQGRHILMFYSAYN